MQSSIARFGLNAENFFADILDDAPGHLIGDAARPDREESKGVLRDTPVVLPSPAHQFLRVASPCATRSTQRALSNIRPDVDQFVPHFFYEDFATKGHVVILHAGL